MQEYDQPPELGPDPEPGHNPDMVDASARVIEFIRHFGDGCVDVVSFRDKDFPLYARDLEVLAKHAGKFVREFDDEVVTPHPSRERRHMRYVTEWKPV